MESKKKMKYKKEIITLTTLVLMLLVLVAPVFGSTLTVSTNKTIYYPNEQLIVTGTTVASESVTIQVLNPSGDVKAIAQGTADSNGNYNITVLTFPSEATADFPYGNYTVKVASAGEIVGKIVQFSAPPKATLNGTVSDELGAVVEGATVTLDGKSTTTDANGNFIFTDLDAGTYTLEVSKTGYTSYTESFSIAAGETKVFSVTIYSKVLSVEYVYPSVTSVGTPTKMKVKVSSGAGAETGVVLTATVTLPDNSKVTDLVTFEESTTAGTYYGVFTPSVPGTYYIVLNAEKAGYVNATTNEFIIQVLAKTDISPVLNKITDAENSVLSSVSALSTQLTNIGNSIGTLKDNVNTVLSSLTSVQSTLSSVMSKLDALSTALSTVSGKVDNVASAVSSGFAGLSTGLNSLKSGVTDVGSSLSTMSSSVHKGLSDMSSLVTATAVLVIITLIIAAVATFKVFKS